MLTANIALNPGTFAPDGNYTPADSESARQWTPIGSENEEYLGTFDGNGKIVSGMYIFSAISASQLGENIRLEIYKGDTAIGSHCSTYELVYRFAMDKTDLQTR